MILLNVFSILKYGAKIFLAVMGFISFDDINVKPVGDLHTNNFGLENVNFVESLPFAEQNTSENLFYADQSYFFTENENSNYPFNFLNNHINEFAFESTNKIFENHSAVFENLIILQDENIDEFDILILQEDNNSETKYCIQFIEEKVKMNTLNSVSVISLPQSND